MIKRITRTILLPLVILLSAAGHAAETITWLTPDFPPIFIRGQQFTGQGYGDQQIRLLTGLLPQYQHMIADASLPRLWYQFEHEDGLCTLNALKTPERMRFVAFSVRSIWSSSNRLIIREADFDKFQKMLDSAGAIDLARLRDQGDFLGAYAVAHSYGSVIDSFIRDGGKNTKLTPLVSEQHPFALLDKGRVDFIFGHTAELNYYKELSKTKESFRTIMAKGDFLHNDAYVACSAGPRGRKIIDDINSLLQRDEVMTQFIEPLRRWYTPEDFAAAKKLRPISEGAH